MKNDKGYIVGALIILLVIIISVGTIIWCISLGYRNEKETVCVIKDKWVKPSSKSSKYLVQCDNEVYEITDLFLKVNSIVLIFT